MGIGCFEGADALEVVGALCLVGLSFPQQPQWFKRQLFGVKSERRLFDPEARQLSFKGMLAAQDVPPTPTRSVEACQRRRHPAVIEKSVADVSFLAGLLLDKFRCHLPLYR